MTERPWQLWFRGQRRPPYVYATYTTRARAVAKRDAYNAAWRNVRGVAPFTVRRRVSRTA